jgi:hypothetical protein
MAKPIQWAPREKRRAVTSAIGNSFLKTVTEPVTNSDSNLKMVAGVPHAAGLIDEMLKLKPGDFINTAELKKRIRNTVLRKIRIEISTAGRDARLCRIVDCGSGMDRQELEDKFTKYASAKALGQRTRSLFGRGALDVLLHHEESVIYSVKGSILARARIYWDKSGEPMCDAENLGASTKRRLSDHGLPFEILDHGTVVQFRIREGTHIPQEEQILAKISNFYILRLIAADPNTEVQVVRKRASGSVSGTLIYDFPVGRVLLREHAELDLKEFGRLPIDMLVARSEVALVTDPANIERRENGLLFVDDNDAVLDLTLLPEFDKNPYLKHLYGIVRITGLRTVLENRLEASEAEAVLTITRDGFDRKNSITQQLFAIVERHVKATYETEEKSQKTGNSERSKGLDKRVNDVLKVLNQFNADETDEEGRGEKPQERDEPIFFSVESARLHAGRPRRVTVYVNLKRVKNDEIVLFESDQADFKIDPDSEVVKARRGQTHQSIVLTVQCDRKAVKGNITALTLDTGGNEIKAVLRILGVDDPPVFLPPDDIAFTAHTVSGDPNRLTNAALLVNLTAFSGMPEVAFHLEEIVGNVSLADRKPRMVLQVSEENVMQGHKVARLVVPFTATGWGQHAVLTARSKRADGVIAHTTCKLTFERPKGNEKFSNFHYEDLGRPVLGDVAGDKIYVNSGYSLHRHIFGVNEEAFNRSLEIDPIAQARAVSVLVETAVFHTATTKFHAGGKKGLHIEPDDPIGSLRPYLDDSKMKLEPKVFQALVSTEKEK